MKHSTDAKLIRQIRDEWHALVESTAKLIPEAEFKPTLDLNVGDRHIEPISPGLQVRCKATGEVFTVDCADSMGVELSSDQGTCRVTAKEFEEKYVVTT